MEEFGKNWLRGQLPSLVSSKTEGRLMYFTAPQRVLLAGHFIFRLGPRSYH